MPWNFGGSNNKSFKEQLEEAYKKAEARRQAGKLPRKSHSSYWLDEEDFREFSASHADPISQHSPEYLMKLAHVRRGIANFVRIVTGRDIPVHFSTGEQSYAARKKTGEEFIVISATTDPAKFDVNVGLALHEGAHMVLSKRTNLKDSIPLYDWVTKFKHNPECFLPPIVFKNMERLFMTLPQVVALTHDIVNVMEDRRIDKWMYQRAVGYRGYYDALYDELWHSPRIDALLLHPYTRTPLLKHYRLRIINISNPFSDPDALPGLREMFDLIDLPNIDRFASDDRWSTWQRQTHKDKAGRDVYAIPALPEMLQNALEIVTLIMMNALPPDQVEDDDGMPLPMPAQTQGQQGQPNQAKKKDDPTPDDEDENNWDIPEVGDGGAPTDFDDEEDDDTDEGEGEEEGTSDADATEDQESDAADDEEGAGACDNDPTDESEAESDGDGAEGDIEDDDEADEELADEDDSAAGSADDDSDEEKESAAGAGDQKSTADDEADDQSAAASKYDPKELDKLLEEMSKFLNGEIEKQDMAPDTQAAMEAMESAGASMSVVTGEFSGKAKVIVYHKLTEQLLQSPTFHFVKTSGHKPIREMPLDKAIEDGARMGNILAHRVRVMSDESPLTYNRQNHGKIDKRMISGLGYDMENVFEHTITERFSPVIVHLTLDSSTSMEGTKWYNAIRLAAALAKCAEKIENLSVVISLRAGDAEDRLAHVLIAYDSRVDTFTKVRTMFPYLRADGGTPEGLCFAAIRDIILAGDRTARKFFVNISDGDPQFDWREPTDRMTTKGHPQYETRSYRDEPAWHHTAQTINDFRASGVTVLSYFMETPSADIRHFYDPQKRFKGFKEKVEHAFRQMYGKDAAFIKPDDVNEIARTLNNMFLAGGK
jgi:hypothetical protein